MKFALTELEEIAARQNLAGRLQSTLQPFAECRDVLRALTPREEWEPIREAVAALRKVLRPHDEEGSYLEGCFRLTLLIEAILQEAAEFDRRYLWPIQSMSAPESACASRRKTVRKRRRRGDRNKELK